MFPSLYNKSLYAHDKKITVFKPNNLPYTFAVIQNNEKRTSDD